MTSLATGADDAKTLPDYAPIPRSALGPALNDQGYYVGRVERNLYWVSDGVYQCRQSPGCGDDDSPHVRRKQRRQRAAFAREPSERR